MTKKENQHYVPTFYLKGFSFNNNQKEIGIFNFETNIFSQKAKLKTQASKAYFYGKNGVVEEDLSRLENYYAPIIKNIANNNIIPLSNSLDKYILFQFIILTDVRNPSHVQKSIKSFEKMIDILKSNLVEGDIYEKLRTTKEESLNHAFSNLLVATEICLDLEAKILINQTDTPLITSDNPVVKYNQFLEKKASIRSITGIALIGIQIFLPINSRKMLVIYDPKIYKIGNRKEKNIFIIDKNEIKQLNLLQFLNCQRIIYFNHNVTEKEIRQIFYESSKYTKANQPIVTKHPVINENGTIKDGSIIATRITECKINLKIKSIKETRYSKSLKIGNNLVYMRKRAEELVNKYKG